MSRVALSRIKALTFYKDELTTSRRGDPIQQLECIGKPCRLYQPEVVRCVNLGGADTEVDWKCEADLPEALRFGRVEVSCEGWDGPGDPYVLKGSCGLQYRLVQIEDVLRRGENHRVPSFFSNLWQAARDDPSAAIFYVFWIFCLLLILYNVLKSCLSRRTGRSSSSSSTPSHPRPPPGPSSGWFPGSFRPDDHTDPPPPYTKFPTASTPRAGGWQPGFLTGAALGGLGTYLLGRRDRERERMRMRAPTAYDWESERMSRAAPPPPALARPAFASGWSSNWAGRRAPDVDRGEGPSDLGRMRTSTGLGSSRVR
ncbi:hypothetical protein CERSUDRAFT_126100 [Gelatoporia subvermispora B]|uniref:Store-operated calcium entry-associated regulatory factor n=1 Tax=Ceriporiopsis subvermispora (strain B) TaxID=914234 RepID=M2PCC3_CERS8|nr:hypothetical protein CERSUDRAFT_126100 [Gelatoporia subvermispora B]